MNRSQWETPTSPKHELLKTFREIVFLTDPSFRCNPTIRPHNSPFNKVWSWASVPCDNFDQQMHLTMSLISQKEREAFKLFALTWVNVVTLSCSRMNVQKTINCADPNSNQIYATHLDLKWQLFLVCCNYVSWQQLLARLFVLLLNLISFSSVCDVRDPSSRLRSCLLAGRFVYSLQIVNTCSFIIPLA